MKRVLIVEDDPDVREVIRDVLEYEGYSVVTARDGAEGFEILRTGEAPQLILLDLNMPVMDGWEFLKARADDEAAAAVPVVVLSAGGLKSKPEGASELFRKPFEMNAILDLARRYCEPAEARPAG